MGVPVLVELLHPLRLVEVLVPHGLLFLQETGNAFRDGTVEYEFPTHGIRTSLPGRGLSRKEKGGTGVTFGSPGKHTYVRWTYLTSYRIRCNLH